MPNRLLSILIVCLVSVSSFASNMCDQLVDASVEATLMGSNGFICSHEYAEIGRKQSVFAEWIQKNEKFASAYQSIKLQGTPEQIAKFEVENAKDIKESKNLDQDVTNAMIAISQCLSDFLAFCKSHTIAK